MVNSKASPRTFFALVLGVTLFISSLAQAADDAKTTFREIEWTALIPPEDLEALMNPPDYLAQITDGSVEDQISSQIQNSIAAATNDRYQQALVSQDVVGDMDGQSVKIPGFIVPLEFSNQRVTEFFLVPYFGACLHAPPPPPNQIILVNAPSGLTMGSLQDPFWISGKLTVETTDNEVATSVYSLDMAKYDPYY